MRRLTSMNVGFVGVLSCLVLVLALFLSTGVASARSTAVHSQTSVTSVSTLQATCKTIHVTAGRSYYGKHYARSGHVRVCQTCKRTYVTAGRSYYGHVYHKNGYQNVCHY
jgi:hypothetical protein